LRTDNLSTSPSWVFKTNGINTSDRAGFIPPLVMSPTNSQTLYFGTYRLYRTTNRGDLWTPISPDLTKGSSVFSTIAEAKSNSSVIYVGTNDGNVQVTKNGGASWTLITAGLPNRSAQYLAVSPSDAATAFVVFSGFGTGHVFKTTDSGGSWADISSNLPDIPVNTILLDPRAPTRNIYIGTDLGVFQTTDGGATWAPFNNGMPKLVVFDLAFNQNTGVFLAATHGRSIWMIAPRKSPVISVTPPTYDYGSVALGTNVDALFMVTNIGEGKLSGDAALSSSAPFSIVSGGTFRLKAGESQTVAVRFTPTTAGNFDANLKFSSNGGNAEAVLTGTGQTGASPLTAKR
jgi:Abnormal spindle-like microcephaly-assoc'd, ASPM-SPD-2-Hydin